jgi:hypothetical protein
VKKKSGGGVLTFKDLTFSSLVITTRAFAINKVKEMIASLTIISLLIIVDIFLGHNMTVNTNT